MCAKVSKIVNDLDSFLAPARCFGCNAHLYRGERLLCAFCRNELPLTEYNFGEENPTDRIFFGRTPVKKASAMLFYEPSGLVRDLLHQLKYRGRQQIGDCLGAWYGEVLAADPGLPRPDWVLPVPLHPGKERKRGYNQCRAFGRAVAARLGAPYSEKWLKRAVESRTQTGKDRWDRWLEIRNAFRARSGAELEGSRVLLLDDVITTGATLEAGCRALFAIPGIQVYVAAIAVVP